jgi:hypothetical protein
VFHLSRSLPTALILASSLQAQTFPSFCIPNTAGVGRCPCDAATNSFTGCPHNGPNSAGAWLAGNGTACVTPACGGDSLKLKCVGEDLNASSVFLQGDAQTAGLVFGQGILCIGGNLKQLYMRTAVLGVVTAPNVTELTVSARSASLGDTIQAGQYRYYQVYYHQSFVRPPCDPTLDSFNASQAIAVLWQ